MATIDDILGNKTTENPPKGNPSAAATTAEEQKSAQTATAQPAQDGDGSESYVEQYKKSNTFTPKTEEELSKEAKKEKREKMFAAIGDGIAALSNLYFTTKGAPNMYDGKNTMSEKTRIRYDRLKKEYEDKSAAYFNGLMKARAADAEVAKEKQKDREWQRKLGLDQEKRDQKKADDKHRAEREAIADERYNQEQKDKKEAEETRRKEREEDIVLKNRDYNFKVQAHNDNTETRRQASKATAARGVRGKRIGFSDGGDNNVGIYENVWKGSMQSIFDTLRSELMPDKSDNSIKFNFDTPQKKEDFVKQNWWKSETAKAQMRALSQLDPALMTGEDNDGVIDYVPGGGDDDEVIDYVPNKK